VYLIHLYKNEFQTQIKDKQLLSNNIWW